MTNPPSLTDRAAGYIREHGLAAGGDHILAAVSGGPDSVALLDILIHLKDDIGIDRITVVHFDHGLRGEESEADAEFVRKLAQGAGLDFHSGSGDVRAFARSGKISIEMAARACRHAFFRKTAEMLGARKIALGHTANDQAEEVLLRLLRGAGPGGLKAMLPATAGGIIRPLLFAAREEIIEHLRARGLAWRFDSSNSEPFCRRNALRLRVFPVLKETFHPEVARTIARFADLARDEDSWWDIQVNEAWGRCAELSGSGAALDLDAVRKLHPALLRRLLRFALEKVRGDLSGIQAVHLGPLFAMVFREMPGKSVRLPGQIEAVRRAGKLLLRIRDAGASSRGEGRMLEVAGPGSYEFGAFVLEINAAAADERADRAPCGPHEVFMDADRVKWPLHIRSWKPGDRFRPLGMKGSKKLQDFFTDSKVPREERWQIPILCDREKILWVAGLRMDDRAGAGPGTRLLVRARLMRSGSAGPDQGAAPFSPHRDVR
ncbi:MAG: tRNA lysidine(34) synthetase TilS [Syntrophobacteraceae bacterium]